MATAWLFDPHAKTKTPLQFKREGEVNLSLIGPAYVEGVDPREYLSACEILGEPSPFRIATYTVKITKKYMYKVWARDLPKKEGPSTRFFDNHARFYEKVLLVKYKRLFMPPLDPEGLSRHLLENDAMFFKPAKMRNCEEPERFEWCLDEDPNIDKVGFVFDYSSHMHVTDMLYVCAVCGKACKKNTCAACKSINYCGKECQKAHWKEHKAVCKR